MNVKDCVAAATITLLGVGTVGCIYAAAVASSVSIVAAIVFGFTATALSSLSIAAIAAWFDRDSTDVKAYFTTILQYFCVAAVATQQILLSLVKGLTEGVSHIVEETCKGRIPFFRCS